ncbi:MAG: hypothetical protein HYU67_01220 [Flavobacteriia bacterium]|nr:hypothetical protein [Flavobacteriia bacterium]
MTPITREEIEKLDLPRVLYKYRTWDTVEDQSVLKNSELYFAPHKSFGYNSHEFEFEYDPNLISDEELYKFYYNNPEYPIESLTQRHLYALEMSQNSPFKDEEHRKVTIDEHMTFLNNIHGILSMTYTFENNRLWKYFSNNFSGYCVGVDKEFMFNKETIDCISGFVDYYPISHKPYLLPPFSKENMTNNIFTRIFNLPDIFSDEKEFRLSKMVHDGPRTYPIDPSLFMEIILGYNMNPNHKDEIIQIRNDKYPKAKLWEQINIEGKISYNKCS